MKRQNAVKLSNNKQTKQTNDHMTKLYFDISLWYIQNTNIYNLWYFNKIVRRDPNTHKKHIVDSSPDRVKPETEHWYLLLLREARSTKEKEQRLVGSESR